jgi:hypothetical protein
LTTRRTVLTATAAGVAAVAAGPLIGAAPASAAAAAERAVPRTLARRSRPLGAGIRTTRTPFPLSHLAISWHGSGRPGVRVRTGAGWSGWRAVPARCDGADRPVRGRRSALLTVPGTLGYEIECTGGAASLAVTELNTVGAAGTGYAASPPGGMGINRLPMDAWEERPAISPGLRIDGYAAKLRYRPRSSWGADESLRFGPNGAEIYPPEHYPLQTLTVHHTAGANNDPDPAATVRAIYYYDTVTQGWGDMGYHFLIDEAGTVYEGRWSGTDTAPAFGPRGADGRLLMANAAHVGGFNAGNIGVVLLGDFTNQLPTAAARQSLTGLLAVLVGAGRLNPLGVTDYVNPSNGATRRVNTIAGHRDWAATQCPGNTFYPQLPSVRQDVQASPAEMTGVRR